MKRPGCKELTEKQKSSTFHPKIQIPKRDLRRSSKTRKCVVLSMLCTPKQECYARQQERTDRNRTTTTHGPYLRKKRYLFEFHCGLVHKPIAIQDAMKNPDAKAAVDKTWGNLQNPPAWGLKKSKPMSEVVPQAQKVGDLSISDPSWTSAMSNTPSLRNISKHTKGGVVLRER